MNHIGEQIRITFPCKASKLSLKAHLRPNLRVVASAWSTTEVLPKWLEPEITWPNILLTTKPAEAWPDGNTDPSKLSLQKFSARGDHPINCLSMPDFIQHNIVILPKIS